MLSRLDDVIYPNRCEVIEIEPSQRYIYPIFKNARHLPNNMLQLVIKKFLKNSIIH